MARPPLDPTVRKVNKSVTIRPTTLEVFMKLGGGCLSKGMDEAARVILEEAKTYNVRLRPDLEPSAPTSKSTRTTPDIFS